MILTGSGRRRNRPNGGVHKDKEALLRPCQMLRQGVIAEQGGIEQRVELGQRFRAQFPGVEL